MIVGGPPTINLMALLMRAGLSGTGQGLQKLKKTPQWRLFMRRFRQLRQKLFRNMDPGFLKCRVLRAEPVDIRDGSVSLEHRGLPAAGSSAAGTGTALTPRRILMLKVCAATVGRRPRISAPEVMADEGIAMLTQPEGDDAVCRTATGRRA